MRIPTWRLALTGGAVIVLAVAGIGFAAASSAPGAPATDVVAAAPTTGSDAAGPLAGLRNRLGAGRLLWAERHLVHATVTVTGRDGQLVNLQFDHGTVQAIGGGRLTIAEAGGTTVTVSTDSTTIVRVGRNAGTIADVKVGAEVFVRSRIDGGTTLAKLIRVLPAAGS